ncbi:MAG TPA: amidohydrolase family protein [Reyranella sp.]|jgi:5-methylthioadenosine/S-adenosylhomocysteine deaminase|nr:amidohydrolase family protein [Reyranella sp.]
MAQPIKADLLLSGCDVVTIDGKNRVIRDGAVAIRGNKIAWIGKASAAKRSVTAKSTIDGSGQIAMPGLIDAHFHTAQTLLRGKLAEIASRRQVKNPPWSNYYIPFEGMLTDGDVYLSGLLAYANMISVGTTCFAEAGGPHPDAMARAAIDTGIRGFVALNTCDQGVATKTMVTTTKKAYDDNVALVKRWAGDRGGTDRVQAWLSLRQIIVCSPELIKAMAEAARALDVKIHTHLCEGIYEIDYSLAKFGKRPAEYLNDLGALNRRMHCAHSVLLSTDEIDLYVKHRASACHCAFNNYAIGPHRLTEMWKRGIDIGLGTDGAASWGTLDIFQVAHTARVGQQAVMGSPMGFRNVLPGETILKIATNGGARALGVEREIGSLEVGKKADILLADRTQLDHTPLYDPYFVAANTIIGRDVRTVVIDGNVVMKDREFLTVDREEIDRRLAERLPRLMERFDKMTA